MTALVLGTAPAALAQAAADPLSRAHDLYNQGQYDAAIRAAADALRQPATAAAANVVAGRAHLERYRQSSDPADLEAARESLAPLSAATLSPRDRVDWSVAMGELLYFDRRFSTAAEFFEIALGHSDELEPGARESLTEWWAEALDQQAQLGPESERQPLYQRILARAEAELQRDDRSLVASYWLAAAAVGIGDLDRAWAAAEAAWLRAQGTGPANDKLREDLDRLVATVIIPERVRHLSPTGDPRPAMALMQQSWEEMKQRYGR